MKFNKKGAKRNAWRLIWIEMIKMKQSWMKKKRNLKKSEGKMKESKCSQYENDSNGSV